MENSVLHKQKFVYRRQRGCQFVPVEVDPCYIIGNIFDYTCATEYTDFNIFPWLNGDINVSNFNSVLANRVTNMLSQSGLTLNDCIQNSVQTEWYVDLRIDDQVIIKEEFYSGYGYTDVPTNSMWRNSLIETLPTLYDYGFTYFLNGNTLTITSLSCGDTRQELLTLNVGINISINCNNN
jgi:hypothetical protein